MKTTADKITKVSVLLQAMPSGSANEWQVQVKQGRRTLAVKRISTYGFTVEQDNAAIDECYAIANRIAAENGISVS